MIQLNVIDISNNDISNNDISNNDISNNDISNNDISNNDISKKNCSKTKFILITVTGILIIFELFLALKLNNLRDRTIIYLALYGQFLLLFSLKTNKPMLVELSHSIFGLCMTYIVFFSFNYLLNLFCFIVLIITLFTRYYYEGCLFLNSLENNVSFVPKWLNYGYIFKSYFIIIIIKLFTIK
jgi:hypothetical protein